MSTKRRPVFSFVVALLSVICLCLGLFTTRSYATDASDSSGVSGSKTASPTELTQDNRQTEVTLSLPSAEHENEYDVVFVMDTSTSTSNNNIDFSAYVDDLLSAIAEKDATVNVGVIKFRGLAFDTIDLTSGGSQTGLVAYSDDTSELIKNAVDYPKSGLMSSGTNLHGGLDLADEWLTADADVPNSHKYVIALTDGKSYIWNSDDNEPTTIYSQNYRHFAIAKNGMPELNQASGYDTASYPYTEYVSDPNGVLGSVFWFQDSDKNDSYQMLYNSTSEELTGTYKYDQYCWYAVKDPTLNPTGKSFPEGEINKRSTTNGSGVSNLADYQAWYEFAPNADWEGMVWQEANPYEIIDNGDGTYTFDLTKPNPDFYQIHANCMLKGLYKAGHLWTDMNAKYNTAAITYDAKSSGGGINIAGSFCRWLRSAGISDMATDISKPADVKSLFDSIEKEIIFMVDSGTVTDKIPDEFTLMEDGTNTFRMTLAGEDLDCAADGDNAWNFGTADDKGVYPYRVEYDKASNSFKWTINVPVENAKKVTLSYTLEINEDAATGEHDTNVSAVLDYTATDGVEGTYSFEIPVVTYTLTTDFTVEKVWDDADNVDGLRPNNLEVQLFADGEAYGDPVTITEDDGWSYTWEGLPVNDTDQSKVAYTVDEVEVPEGYEAAFNETEDGITIINTHIPVADMTDFTIKKVWDDHNDADHVRPKSITVQLYADGEAFGEPQALTADDNWTITFQHLLVHGEDGHVIEYTAEETEVPKGYTASVEVAHRVATITNTHGDDVTPAPTPTPDKGKKRVIPQTSDLLSPGTIGTLVCLAGLALGAAFVIRRHNSGK